MTFCSSDTIATGIKWHLVMPMASSIAPLHSLGQDHQNKVQYDFLLHVMSLVPGLASHDAICSQWHNYIP